MQASNALELDHSSGFNGKIVNSVILHPDQQHYLQIAGAALIIGDLKDTHNQQFLRGHDDQITCMAVGNQGNLIASGQSGENSDVMIWDFHKKALRYKFSEHDHAVQCVAFSHDDKLLLSCGNTLDGKVFFWDMSSGYVSKAKIRCIVTSFLLSTAFFSEAPRSCVFGGYVKDVKLRETQNYQIALAGAERLVHIDLDPYKGQASPKVISSGSLSRSYTCLAFSKPDQKYMFIGTTSGDFCSFQLKNKILVFTQAVCSGGVTAIAVINQNLVAVGGGDSTLAVYRVQDNLCEEAYRIQLSGGVNSLDQSPDGVQLFVSTQRGFLHRVRASDGSSMVHSENHTAGVNQVYYQPSISERYGTCSADRTIRLWDANEYQVYARFSAPTGEPLCFTFTDQILISGWSDGKIRAYRVDTCEPLWTIDNAHKNEVSAIYLSPNLKFICTGGGEGDVRVWEIKSREMISHLKEHKSRITKLELFSDGMHLLSASRDSAMLVWDLKEEKRVSSHVQRMGGINGLGLGIAGDQNKVISVGQEKKITEWDLRILDPVRVINAAPTPTEVDELYGVSISKTGKFFATGGVQGIVRAWDYESMKCVGQIKGHSNTITSVAISPDSKQIVSTGLDGITLVSNAFI